MEEQTHRPIGRTVIAVLVLLIAGWFALHFVLGILSFVFSTALLIILVVAVVWALKILL
jgi:hypothetical protein